MTIDELNDIVLYGDFDEFVRVCEARQCKVLSRIADDVCERGGLRLVLAAGCSSAGKTTTAKRLCTQLRVNGVAALHLSTDDYFKGDEFYPKNPDGTPDYEHVDCVDRDRLADDINRLIAGERIKVHKFDFITHKPFDDENETLALPENGVVVLEGLHALNPLFTEHIDNSAKFRMFIEPKPNLEVFGPTKLQPSQNRLFRRMVRDNQFRKTSPVVTLKMWPMVRAGEKRWIDPFWDLVDVAFDSSLDYELAVLKPYVQGLLEKVRISNPGDVFIQSACELFRLIESASPNAVPGDSILRETIGGSQLSYE